MTLLRLPASRSGRPLLTEDKLRHGAQARAARSGHSVRSQHTDAVFRESGVYLCISVHGSRVSSDAERPRCCLSGGRSAGPR